MRVFGFWVNDIAFAYSVGFLVGIALADYGVSFGVVLAASAIVTIGLALLWRKEGLAKVCAAVIGFLFLGTFYFHIFQGHVRMAERLPFSKTISFKALVLEEPQPSEKFWIVTAEAEAPLAGRLTILAPPESAIRYGDQMEVRGKIRPADGNGRDPSVYLPRITILGRDRASWLRGQLIKVKEAVLKIFERLLPGAEAGLLGGIAFGSKVDLGVDLKQALARSGTTHLVAVSGYNITIILYAVERALGRFLARRTMLAVALGCAFLFILMTGLQPSAIRAGIMGLIAVIAGEVGGRVDMRNALVFSAASMTLFGPTLVVHDLGFQLSFLSLAGIVYLDAPLHKLFHIVREGILGWRASAITTLSAQLAVFPVLSAAFGGLSVTALGANVLVLGTVPLTMFLGFLLAFLGALSAYLAFGLAQIIHLLLAYQIGVIRFFSALWIPLMLPSGIAVAAAYYGVLIWFASTFRHEK